MEDGALDVSGIDSGRWGEVEIEKGPVDLFPTEPTDEDRQVEETLNSGFKVFSAQKIRTQAFA